MRTKPAFATFAVAAFITGCTSTAPATSFDDVIAAVGYRASDVPPSDSAYRKSEVFGARYHPQYDLFRGEDAMMTVGERVAASVCSNSKWRGNQTKPDPFASFFQNRAFWDRSRQEIIKGLYGEQFVLSSRLRRTLFGSMNLTEGGQYRNGLTTRFRDFGDAASSPRGLLHKIQDAAGLPFEARSLNHHGCRDAMISFYRSADGIVGVLIYKQKAGPTEVDIMIGNSADEVAAELTSTNIHWKVVD